MKNLLGIQWLRKKFWGKTPREFIPKDHSKIVPQYNKNTVKVLSSYHEVELMGTATSIYDKDNFSFWLDSTHLSSWQISSSFGTIQNQLAMKGIVILLIWSWHPSSPSCFSDLEKYHHDWIQYNTQVSTTTIKIPWTVEKVRQNWQRVMAPGFCEIASKARFDGMELF